MDAYDRTYKIFQSFKLLVKHIFMSSNSNLTFIALNLH